MARNKLVLVLGSLSLLIGTACSGERDEELDGWEAWGGPGGGDDGGDDGGDGGDDGGDGDGTSDGGSGDAGDDGDDGGEGSDTGDDGASDSGAGDEDDCADYRTVYPAGPYGTSVGSVLDNPPGMVDGNGTPHDFFEIYQDKSKVALVIVTAFET
jgi:hypothetical protein